MYTYTLWKIDIDPENDPFLLETNLPTPMTARVYVHLLEGNIPNKYSVFNGENDQITVSSGGDLHFAIRT